MSSPRRICVLVPRADDVNSHIPLGHTYSGAAHRSHSCGCHGNRARRRLGRPNHPGQAQVKQTYPLFVLGDHQQPDFRVTCFHRYFEGRVLVAFLTEGQRLCLNVARRNSKIESCCRDCSRSSLDRKTLSLTSVHDLKRCSSQIDPG